MKRLLLILLGWAALANGAFSQCPTPGLRIQSAACEPAKALKLNALSCTEIEATWTGNKNQTYAITASCTEVATNGTEDARVSETACDNNGNCRATVAVKEGARVNVSVQTACAKENAVLYSAEVITQEIHVPLCTKRNDVTPTNGLRVYPNPATDYLFVEYAGKNGNTEFRILDVTAKKVLGRREIAPSVNSRYKLSLHNIPSGAYLLEAVNGKDVDRAKFVVARNK